MAGWQGHTVGCRPLSIGAAQIFRTLSAPRAGLGWPRGTARSHAARGQGGAGRVDEPGQTAEIKSVGTATAACVELDQHALLHCERVAPPRPAPPAQQWPRVASRGRVMTVAGMARFISQQSAPRPPRCTLLRLANPAARGHAGRGSDSDGVLRANRGAACAESCLSRMSALRAGQCLWPVPLPPCPARSACFGKVIVQSQGRGTVGVLRLARR